MESARALKEKGIDAVNVPDSPRAQAKMGAVSASVVLQQAAGIEAIPHYTCKDKNLLALQADILGAHALGIRNILLVTGDPPNMGTYPDATAVFNIDAIGLCNMVSMLNRGFDLGRNPVGEPTGVLLRRGAEPQRREPGAGAGEVPLEARRGGRVRHHAARIRRAASPALPRANAAACAACPSIAGIWPLVSLRMAEFMKNEVPGVFVPDSVIERMTKCDTKESALEEGTAIARELLEALRGAIAGVQVATPLGKIQYALTILGR